MIRCWVLLLALLCLGATDLHAGSIFMKNGYIIQGPVVEQDEDAVVLGWENGEVTIYRRFIDSVSYDPGEESRIEKEAQRREKELAEADNLALQASAAVEIEDLPADLDVFLKLYGGGSGSPTPSGGDSSLPADDGPDPVVVDDTQVPVPVDGTDSPEPGDGSPPVDDGTLQTDVTPVEAPEPKLGERIFTAQRELSIQPPAGWDVKEQQGVLMAVGPRSESGVQPSINVLSFPRSGLPVEELIQMVKEEQQAILQGYELLSEQERESDGGAGYEIVARGSFENRTMVLRQFVVPADDKVWLVSAFSEGEADDPAAPLFEVALRTVQLSAE